MSQYTEILKTIPHNTRELARYIKFIEKCVESNSENYTDIHLTAHHICPEASDMFPQYGSFTKYPWNKALLTDRQHYLAHMMLWKVYRNRSMTFAFNMMSNFQQIHHSSKLYEKYRIDFRKFISELNSRPRTEEEKLNQSKKIKNSLVVYDIRDPEKIKFRIWKDDPDYDPNYHVYYRTGYKHPEETKMRIGRRGKKCCYEPETNDIKFLYEDEIPEGYIWGYPKGVITADHIKGTVWCYNPITLEHIRVHEDEIPDNFVKGKLMENNPGFDKANSMINVVDFKNKKVDKVFEIDFTIHGPESGVSAMKTFIFTFRNNIFTSKINLVDFLENEGYYIELGPHINESAENVKVKKPHHNCKKEVNDFRQKYQGNTYKELGLRIYHLENFDLFEHTEKEIYWNEKQLRKVYKYGVRK